MRCINTRTRAPTRRVAVSHRVEGTEYQRLTQTYLAPMLVALTRTVQRCVCSCFCARCAPAALLRCFCFGSPVARDQYDLIVFKAVGIAML